MIHLITILPLPWSIDSEYERFALSYCEATVTDWIDTCVTEECGSDHGMRGLSGP